MSNVDSLCLLVTSGEKLFKDIAFWTALSGRKSQLSLEVLVLDPNSSAAKERARIVYRDKGAGFFEDEIRESIETLRRMSDYFAKKGEPVTVSCAQYDSCPSFRMTFIGTNRLLVTAYDEVTRTGDNTPFLSILADTERSLIRGFEKEYQRVRGSSQKLI
jgi:hypothetical protein